MTKRLVEIDDDVLAAARTALGTGTLKETVNRALAEAVAAEARRAFLCRMSRDGLPDLGDPEVMAAAWR
ncbi:MAG: type II toxin-antitoxin system VapB family antitoxin [Mycobacteriales bacterium]